MDPMFWVPQPSMLPENSQHVQHDQQRTSSSSLEDWSKERPAAMSQTGAVGTGSSATHTMDMSDFTNLGDMAVNSPSLLVSPQTFYSQLTASHNPYFMSQYPTLQYSNAAWNSLPLSSYSTLNGATNSSATQQQPNGQQSPPHPQTTIQSQSQSSQPNSQSHDQSNTQQMIIDPSLTLSTSPANLQQHYASSSLFTSQPQRQAYPYTQTSGFISPFYRQQPSTPQGTLSPQALMNPSSLLTSISPSAFYGNASSTNSASHQSQPDPQPSNPQQQQQQQNPPAQPSVPQPQEPSAEEIAQRKAKFHASIKPLLLSSAFTGAQAVNTLVDRIYNNLQDVDASIRLDILTKIRDGAGNHYFRAWSENPRAMDITREWLKAAHSATADGPLIETTMPLLHIIDRLPLTVETLKASKLGKLVVKLVKDPPSPAIKDMASNIERRWRQLVLNVEGAINAPNNTSAEDSKSKKRKPSEAPGPRTLPPQKKLAVSSTTSTKPTAAKDRGKLAVPTAAAVKDAKSDSSFFSAPKPKPKLPSFKKAPLTVQVKKEENVAQPSSVDPFQDILKSMKARKESPAVSTPPPTSSVYTSSQTNNTSKNGKKKKAVTWAPEDQLESVKLIERAVYDDDPLEGTQTTHSLRDLDRGEGAALHAHLFEEIVDWQEPSLIEMPAGLEVPPRGEGSQEKETQEQREQTALGALYMTPEMIPLSPSEPVNVIPEEEVDKDVVTMICGESDEIFWHGGTAIEPVSHSSSVADLVGQLATGGSVDPALGGTHFNGQGLDLKSVGLDTSSTLSAVSALPQEQLQQLLHQLASYGPTAAAPPSTSTSYDIDPAWGTSANQFPTNDHGYAPNYNDEHERERWPSEGGRGRGRNRGRGRGRGRGGGRGGDGGEGSGNGSGDDGYRPNNKRKPVSFFSEGRRTSHRP